jgi:hypothetical protein
LSHYEIGSSLTECALSERGIGFRSVAAMGEAAYPAYPLHSLVFANIVAVPGIVVLPFMMERFAGLHRYWSRKDL